MSNKKIIANIKYQLNIKVKIDEKTKLKTLNEWDSLGHLTFIGIADNDYSKRVTGDDLIKCGTVGDLAKLINKDL